MRKWLVLMVVLAVPALAQDTPAAGPVCCREDATGQVKPWDLLRECPKGWTKLDPAECGIIPTPTPVVEPTVVPTVVPTPEAPWEPKEYSVPWFVKTIIGWAVGAVNVPVVWGSAAAGICVWLIAMLRQIAALFGAKIGPKLLFILNAVIAFLVVMGPAVADGNLAGAAEVSSVLNALVAMLASFFGYKVLLSDAAKTWRADRTK